MPSGRRVIYEVDVTVDAGAADAYAAWLPGHIDRVLENDGFLSAQWLEADTGAAAARWSIRYTVTDAAALEAYFAGPASALRAEAEERFGGRFAATRRVMFIRDEFKRG
jgi:hypothetical protein